MPVEGQNVVDENFWVNLGAERVYNALQKMQESAERLQKAIVWIFGVYSTITFGAVIWSKKEDWNIWAIVFFGISFVLLIISYYVSTLATFSKPTAIHVNAAADVKTAYEEAIKKFYQKFRCALILCSAGVVLYCIALTIQFTSPVFSIWAKKPAIVKIVSDSLDLNIKQEILTCSLAVNIHSKKQSWVTINLSYDTLICKKKRTLGVSSFTTNNNIHKSLPTLVYVDTLGVVQFDIKYSKHANMTLEVTRTDSTIGNRQYKQHKVWHKLD